MGSFVSGAVTATGANYTPASSTDNALVWLVYSYRPGTNAASAQDFGGTSMTEEIDLTDNITGNADPQSSMAWLENAGASSQTLSHTFSSTPTFHDGWALTLENIDQTTPVNNTDSALINTHTDKITYSAVSGDVAVYYKFYAGTASPSFTTPTGFTLRYTDTVITSPAYRVLVIYTRDVDSTETSTSLGADSSGGSVAGGMQGVIVFNGSSGGAAGIPIFRRRIEGY